MKFGVVVFPGSNCDHDAYYALGEVLHQPVEFLWHQSEQVWTALTRSFCPAAFPMATICALARLPSFLRSCARSRNSRAPADSFSASATAFKFCAKRACCRRAAAQCRHAIYLPSRCIFASKLQTHRSPLRPKPGQVLQIPIAHGDGNYFCDAATLADLERNHQIVFRYTTPDGREDRGGESERIARKYRRRLQSRTQRGGPDAASGTRGGSGARLRPMDW